MTGPSELTRLLRRLPIFGALEQDEAALLASRCAALRYQRGMTLFHEGELAANLMVLVTGKVEISCQVEGGPDVEVAVLDPGALIGEMALLDTAPRSATARAAEDSVVLVMEAPVFFDLIAAGHPAASEILRTVIRQVSGRIRALEATVDRLLLASGSPGARPAELGALKRVLA